MPKHPNVRNRHPKETPIPSDPAAVEERKKWLEKWKDWAIQKLPISSSTQTRATLRKSVDQALFHYGVKDSTNEIQDIVSSIVEETKLQIVTEEAVHQRATRKKELLDLAEHLLEVAIGKFPVQVVGPPHSGQRVRLVSQLCIELRSLAHDRLTGDEPIAELLPLIQECLVTLENQHFSSKQGRFSTIKTILFTLAGAAAGAGLTAKFPKVQTNVQKGVDFLRTQVPWEELFKTLGESSKTTNPEGSPTKHNT